MTTRREFITQTAAQTLIAAGSIDDAPAATNAARTDHKRSRTYRIPRTDLTVSRLAFGCAMLGWDWTSPDFSAKSVPLIETAHEQGITLFDVADVYGHGGAERALGEVLRSSPGMRHHVVIQTKCGDRFLENFTIDNSRDHIVASAEASLGRLDTDYLDLLLLHWPDSLVQPDEVARAFDDLKHSGKVRYFGVSNHSPTQYELLQKYVRQPLVANQIQLGLQHWCTVPRGLKASFTHGHEGAATLDYCRLHNIWVQAYSPLRVEDDSNSPSLLRPPDQPSAEVREAVKLLADLANRYAVTPAAIMLAWLLRHPAGITPILGGTKSEHVIADCAAENVELTRVEWYALLAAASKLRTPSFE